MNTEAYPNNKLANSIYQTALTMGLNDGGKIVPVTTEEIVDQIKNSPIKQLDYRAKIQPENGIGSIFSGLAFDPKSVRIQSLALYEQENPVGIMSFVVAPKTWIKKQRYFKRKNNGVEVVDAQAITGEKLPDFYIIPAWTKVIDSHLLKFAIPGFRAFKKIIKLIQESASQNTWMELIAQGQFEERSKLAELLKREIGTFIPKNELPFQLDMIGKNNQGSSSSRKMAKLLGLKQVENLGSGLTLGPVFVKEIN
ncbi:hypothetical protein ACFL18_00620 [Patescibacteria group bacterium]